METTYCTWHMSYGPPHDTHTYFLTIKCGQRNTRPQIRILWGLGNFRLGLKRGLSNYTKDRNNYMQDCEAGRQMWQLPLVPLVNSRYCFWYYWVFKNQKSQIHIISYECAHSDENDALKCIPQHSLSWMVEEKKKGWWHPVV